MNKRYYEHTLPIIRGSLSNTYLDKAASHLEFGAPLISLTIVIQGITSSGELVNFIRILKNEQ